MIDRFDQAADWAGTHLVQLIDWMNNHAVRLDQWAHHALRTPHTHEGWADAATLGMLALMFWVMDYYAIRRTWRWERLGTALTIVVTCLAISYSFGTITIFLTVDLWIPIVRWLIRAALLGAGAFAIIVMRIDRPPEGLKAKKEPTP